MASFGFLALHALATPDVLLGKNAGFELATPVGLVVAGALAALSAVELSEGGRRRDAPLELLVGALVGSWCCGASSRSRRRGRSTSRSRSSSSTAGSCRSRLSASCSSVRPRWVTCASTGGGARLRRRGHVRVRAPRRGDGRDRLGANWRVSWWEWHVLMLLAFVSRSPPDGSGTRSASAPSTSTARSPARE